MLLSRHNAAHPAVWTSTRSLPVNQTYRRVLKHLPPFSHKQHTHTSCKINFSQPPPPPPRPLPISSPNLTALKQDSAKCQSAPSCATAPPPWSPVSASGPWSPVEDCSFSYQSGHVERPASKVMDFDECSEDEGVQMVP